MNGFVWIDTSFLYALLVARDQNHDQARLLWGAFVKRHIQGVMSNLIISELGTLLLYHFGSAVALRQTSLMLDTRIITRVYVDAEIESSALGWWKRYADQAFSFPDIVSFEIMRRTGIRQALSFDCDFTIAGFELVRTPYAL